MGEVALRRVLLPRNIGCCAKDRVITRVNLAPQRTENCFNVSVTHIDAAERTNVQVVDKVSTLHALVSGMSA